MGKWWGLLFGVTMMACLALFLVAPFVGWWLPEGVSTHSDAVDQLFYIILYITGFFFILTEGLLVYFMIRFSGREEGVEKKEPPRAEAAVRKTVKKYLPNEHRVELAWTIVPAVILLYIAFAQIGTWAEIKYISSMDALYDEGNAPLSIAVSARQFEWRMRYPSPATWEQMKKDKKFAKRWHLTPQYDDVHIANELHVWTAKEPPKDRREYPAFVCHLSTIDVQHNFNLPHFRVKQDALPGKIIPVWFRPMKSNGEYDKRKKKWIYKGGNDENDEAKIKTDVWEIACAELCGRWHYHMIGRIYVHPNEDNYLEWLDDATKQGTTRLRK